VCNSLGTITAYIIKHFQFKISNQFIFEISNAEREKIKIIKRFSLTGVSYPQTRATACEVDVKKMSTKNCLNIMKWTCIYDKCFSCT
jgi:hypothetical protein